MSLTDEERRAIVVYRVEKARMAMEQIDKVMPLGVWAIVANRMYYALYYAASALLISAPGQSSRGKNNINHKHYRLCRTIRNRT